MSIFAALILGIIQGLTEFIPVSSSGHLVLAHQALGVSDGGLAFDVALHIGTLLALVCYFHRDIVLLAKGIFGRNEYRQLAWLLVAATIPAVVAGMLLEQKAEDTFRSSTLVAINLIVVALLMLWAERFARRYQHKTDVKQASAKQALVVGLAQAAAIVPGVSRSGGTITAGLFMGLDRVSATRFSFLLGMPVTFGAIVKVLSEDATTQRISDETDVFVVGVAAAFLAGIFAIKFLLHYLSKHTLAVFAYYRIALGVIVLLLAAL